MNNTRFSTDIVDITETWMARLAIKRSQLFQLSQVSVVEEWAAEMLYIAESVSFKTTNMLLHELIHFVRR